MTYKEIINYLCIYDSRNPEYMGDSIDILRRECHCQNCFYGRNKLALELLKYIKE